MHLAVVLLTMLALPLASVLIDRAGGGAPTWALVAKWFVFWGAGVRLAIAGVRQIGWPALTASGIFGVTDPRALPLAQELGFWNLTVARCASQACGFRHGGRRSHWRQGCSMRLQARSTC